MTKKRNVRRQDRPRSKGKAKGRRKSRNHIKRFLALWLMVMLGSAAIAGYWYFKRIEISVDKRRKEAILYFADSQALFLVREQRKIPEYRNLTKKAEAIVLALVEGPRKKGLVPTLPPTAAVRRIEFAKEGTMIVDFTDQIVKAHPGGTSSELLTIYSVVNSLCFNLPEVKRIKILVNGREIESIAGHIYSKEPFEPDKKLVGKRLEVANAYC